MWNIKQKGKKQNKNKLRCRLQNGGYEGKGTWEGKMDEGVKHIW